MGLSDPLYTKLRNDATTASASGVTRTIPNYFGMWDQQLSAYFWNPSLAMIATGRYSDMAAYQSSSSPPMTQSEIQIPYPLDAVSCGRQPRCDTRGEAGCPFYRAGVS